MPLPAYRDLVRVEQNIAQSEEQFPRWEALITRLWCTIESATGGQATGGGEPLVAEQQAGVNDYAVTCPYYRGLRTAANMRLLVIGGPYADMLLEVVTTGFSRKVGRVAEVRLTCRELEERQVA